MTPRKQAENALQAPPPERVKPYSQTARLRGIGWAILDLADAIREVGHALADRPAQTATIENPRTYGPAS